MRVLSVGSRNFRNLREARVGTDFDVVVIEGENGSGKTSFLESVYSCLLMSSFRTRRLGEMIRRGCDFLEVSLDYDDGVRHSVNVTVSSALRSVTLDGSPVRSRAELLSAFPCVVLTLDDRTIVGGEPRRRRRFFDQAACFARPELSRSFADYSACVRDRNVAIRDGHGELLDSYDRRLAELGYGIYCARKSVCESVRDAAAKVSGSIFGTAMDFSVEYVSQCAGIASREEYASRLKRARDRDVSLSCTSFGVHDDDFRFLMNGMPAKETASAGQTRLLAVVMRLAEIEWLKSLRGVSPLVLADDAFLELDRRKKAAVFGYLSGIGQVFFALMPGEDFYSGADGVSVGKITMKDGALSER